MAHKRWPMLAALFAVGAAVGAAVGVAGATTIGRRSRWDGYLAMGPIHQRGEPALDSTHDDTRPNDGGTRTPDLAVSMSAADGNGATT
jgi:hypothetical protein